MELTILYESIDAKRTFRAHVNSYRAGLVEHLDQRKLQRCLSNMRGSMRMAIDSLEGGAEDNLNTSNI